MSRRYFVTNDQPPVTITIGFDPPLQHFFLDISRTCPGCDGSGEQNSTNQGEIVGLDYATVCTQCHGEGTIYLFNNLDAPAYQATLGGMTLRQALTEMRRYVDDLPTSFVWQLWSDLTDDRENDVSNYHHDYGAIGKLRTEPTTPSDVTAQHRAAIIDPALSAPHYYAQCLCGWKGTTFPDYRAANRQANQHITDEETRPYA